MSATYTWDQVVSAITGVVNRGAFSRTFTPATTAQSASGQAGYYSSVYTACNAISLSGNTGTGQVLAGYTFYNNSLTMQTGTMPNRGVLNWAPAGSTSYSVPAGYYSGGTLNSSSAYNVGYNAGVAAGSTVKLYSVRSTSSSTGTRLTFTQGSTATWYPITISLNFTHRIVGIWTGIVVGASGQYYQTNSFGLWTKASFTHLLSMVDYNGASWETAASITIYVTNRSTEYDTYIYYL